MALREMSAQNWLGRTLRMALAALLLSSIFIIPFPVTFSQSDLDNGSSESSSGESVADPGDASSEESGEESEDSDDSDSADENSGNEAGGEESSEDPESGEPQEGDEGTGDQASSDGSDSNAGESSREGQSSESSAGNQTNVEENPGSALTDSEEQSDSENSSNQTSDETFEPPAGNQTGSENSDSSELDAPASKESSTGNQTSKVSSSDSDSESSDPEVQELYMEIQDDGSGVVQLEEGTAEVEFDNGSIYFGDTIQEGGTLNMTVMEPEELVALLPEEELEEMAIQEEAGEFEVVVETGSGYTMEGSVVEIEFDNVTLAQEEGVTIALEYDNAGLSEDEERGVRVLHFNHDMLVWEVLSNDDDSINGGEEVDIVNNIAYGTTYSFSHFVPGSDLGGPNPPTIDTPTSPTSDNTPTITGTKDAFTEVRLFDFVTDTFLGIAASGPSTTWSIDTSVEIPDGLEDGLHVLYAVSANGGGTSTSNGTEIIIDTTAPPAPEIIFPIDNDVFDSSPDIEGNVAANFITQWGEFGTTGGDFDGPYDIAVSPDGDSFVVDNGNGRVQYFAGSSFILDWNGDDGAGPSEQFAGPVSIAMDADGFLFVGDNVLQNIQKFDNFGGFVTSWGESGSGDSQFANPMGIAAWGSDQDTVVYVADTGNHRIQKFDGDGNFIAKWGKNGGDGTSGSAAGEFNSPYGLSVDADGNVYVADTGNDRIQKFDSNGNFTAEWGSSGFGEGEFNFPRGIGVDIAGNVYVADELNDRIQKFDSEGNFIVEWGEFGIEEGQFDSPKKMGFDELGNAYVVDTGNHRIQTFDADSGDPVITIFSGSTTIGTLSPAPLTGFWFITPDPELESGTYTVNATVTDAAGNTSPASNNVTFTITSANHTGGPDNFGYTYIDSTVEGGPVFEFFDISETGTEILSDHDMESQNVTIGFDFDYYGQTYSYVNVTTKGVLAFEEYDDGLDNEPLETALTQKIIAPFWDDLITLDTVGIEGPFIGAGEIYNETQGTAPNRIFIVQWNEVKHYYNSTSGILFEVMLFENSSNILFQYGDIEFGTVDGAEDGSDDTAFADDGGAATVGIKGSDEELLEYSFNSQVLEDGLAILFEHPGTTMPTVSGYKFIDEDGDGLWGEEGTVEGVEIRASSTVYDVTDSNDEGGPVYDFIDISGTGTEILSDNDFGVENVPIGFDFEYYSINYTNLNIETKGVLSFSDPVDDFVNEPLADSEYYNFIAPFWEDLVTLDFQGGELISSGEIFYETQGEEGSRMFIVQWNELQHWESSEQEVTLQVILFEGSNEILFQYRDMVFGVVFETDDIGETEYDNGLSATVGVKGPADGFFTQYSHKEGVIQPELAILLTPETVDYGSDITDADGFYSIGDLPLGTDIMVFELTPDDYIPTTPDGGVTSVFFEEVGGLDVDFGNMPAGTVSGYKFMDADGDGIWEEGEDPMPDVLICAFSEVTFEETCVTTDEQGFYSIQVPAGDVEISETEPDGYLQTAPEGDEYFLIVDQGELVENQNFGNMLETGTVYGFKFEDVDGDGVWDETEDPLGDVLISAFGSGYNISDSDEDGGPTYEFVDISSDEGATEILANEAGFATEVVELGFNFTFFDEEYDVVEVATVGELYIGDGIVSAFSDELITSDSEGAGSIFYKTEGEEGSRQFIVQWDDMKFSPSSPAGITFQVILYETDGQILFQYEDVIFGDEDHDLGALAFVGIEGPNLIEFVYSENEAALNDFFAISFTPSNNALLGSYITDSDGFYSIQDLPAGVEIMVAEKVPTDFEPTTPEGGSTVVILTEEEARIDFGNQLIDITPPEAPIINSPIDGTTLNDNVPLIEGTAEPDSTVEVFDEFEEEVVSLGTTVTDECGCWQLPVSPALVDGVHVFTAMATDGADNGSPASAETTITIDTESPSTPDLIAPVNNANSSDNTPTFEWSEAEDSTAVTYELFVDDDSDFSSIEESESGIESLTFTFEGVFADGTYYWKVRSTDQAGNSNNSTAFTFTIDTAAPSEPSLLLPADGSTIDDDTPAFDWTDSTDANAVTYALEVDDNLLFTSREIAELALDSSAFTPFTALAEGTYFWKVTATDAAGNSVGGIATFEFTIDLDTEGPSIELDPITPSVTNGDVVITATATDADNNIAAAEFFIDVVGEEGEGTAVSPSDETFNELAETVEGVIDISSLSQGTHTLSVRAQDAIGNWGPVDSDTFVVDTVAPTAPVLLLPADGGMTGVSTPTLNWTIPEDATAVVYDLLVDNNADFTSPEEWFDDADLSVPHTVGDPLADGTYFWKVRATDEAGNEGEFSNVFSFTVDTVGSISVEPATELGPVDFVLEEGELESIAAVEESSLPDVESKPENIDFPFGFFSWTVTGLTPGDSVNMTLTYPEDVPPGSLYWKVIDGEWVDASSLLGSNDGDEIITLTIVDGGFGDVDGQVNGQVSDPGGVGEGSGNMTIRKVKLGSDDLLGGAAFTISPDPFTLEPESSLVVADNDVNDSNSTDGIIEIIDMGFATYTLVETTTPEGYERVVTSLTVSVHSGNPEPVVTVENRAEGEEVEEVTEVPPPQLDEEEVEEFNDHDATVNDMPVNSTNLPPALIAPEDQAGDLDPDDVIYGEEADNDATGSELFTDFDIPTYPAPDESIAGDVVYAPPAFVIPKEDGSNFVLTPIIEEVFENMTLLLLPPEETKLSSASIQSVDIEFGQGGSDIGFSFELSADIPGDLPDLDDIEETALFLDVDFVGDIDFSNPDSFASPPEFVILVSKDLGGEQLPDGCPDIELYLLNENTNEWELVDTPDRNPSGDTADECSYIVHTEHFSKFAIGSVKGSISTVSTRGAGSGGDSSRTVSVDGTFADEYFEINPLGRVSVAQTSFLTVSGQRVSEFSTGETVQISSTIRNHQRDPQSYVFIVQIVDKEGTTLSISWAGGMLERAETYSLGQSWLAEEAGDYQVKIFIWSGWDSPEPLSSVSVRTLQVSDSGPTVSA